MPERIIPQRELRNNIAAVLREAEAGTSFTVTVRGRPVARLVPPGHVGAPRVDVDRASLEAILRLPADPALAQDLDDAEPAVGDPRS